MEANRKLTLGKLKGRSLQVNKQAEVLSYLGFSPFIE